MTDAVKGELHSISADSNKLDIKDVPDNEFRSQAVTDYIIINPEHDEHYQLRVFLRVPITQGGFWVLTDEEAAIGFIDRFLKMWNRDTSKNRTTGSSLLGSKGVAKKKRKGNLKNHA
jgi:hypothetical protein